MVLRLQADIVLPVTMSRQVLQSALRALETRPDSIPPAMREVVLSQLRAQLQRYDSEPPISQRSNLLLLEGPALLLPRVCYCIHAL